MCEWKKQHNVRPTIMFCVPLYNNQMCFLLLSFDFICMSFTFQMADLIKAARPVVVLTLNLLKL